MNERIKYLAIKSGLDFDGYGYPIWGSCEDEKKEFLEKFAELIVRECVQVSLKNSHRYDDMGTIIAGQIQEHFGVSDER